MKPMSYLKYGILAATVVMLLSNTAHAAEFMKADDDGVVSVPSAETHRNLYAAGGTVVINGKTNGDLYVAGGTVNVDGEVENDLVVAGGTVNLDGNVGGDIRAAGGTVSIDGAIAGDVVVMAGTLIVSEKATIGGDLVVNGGSVTMDGKVAGKSWVRAGQLTFGPASEAVGPVIYTGKDPAVVKEGAKIASLENKPWRTRGNEKHAWAGMLTGLFLIKLLAMIIAGLLLIRFFPRRAHLVADQMYRDPLKNLGIGFLSLILAVIISGILIVTLVGMYVGLVVLAWLALTALLAMIIATVFLGAWLIKVITKKPELVLDWQAVLIGTVVCLLVYFIPILGCILIFVLFLIAFGALVRFHKNDVVQNR